MVRDRLAELRERAGLLPHHNGRINDIPADQFAGGDAANSARVHAGDVRISISQGGRHSSEDVSQGSVSFRPTSDESPTFMEQFFARVNALYRALDELSTRIQDVRRLHDDVLFATSDGAVSRAREQRDRLMNDIKKNSRRAHEELKLIEKDNFDAESKPHRANSAVRQEARIRRSQFESLSQRFREIMEHYNHAQVAFRDKTKDKLKRQLIITGKAPENDAVLDDMLEKGDAHVFTQGIVAQTEVARSMLQDIEDRHNDFIKLEQSIKDLHDLFLDMAMLVQGQGEMVDNIERNVEGATVSVETGAVQLRSAKQMQRSARRKMICLVFFIIVVILIILLVLHFYAKLF